MDFTHIIGHEETIANLKKAIEKGYISHSYLFEGEESIGKRKVALAFAKTLLCRAEGTEPCNRCNSCLKFDNFNHPDFTLIEPEKELIEKKKIDKLLSNINIAPLESKKKIIIIDDSNCMRLETQNALLKTLEEPPPYINIVLITSNSNNIIPTILSRCEIVNFYPVQKDKIEKLLIEKYGKTKEEANFIAHFTKGSLGKSIIYSESPNFFKLRDETLDIVDQIIRGDEFNIFMAMDFFNGNKDNYEDILDILLYWFRDLALYKRLGSSGLLINQDKTTLLSNQSFLKEDRINDIIDRVMETRENINRNVNYQLAIETMLLNMQEV